MYVFVYVYIYIHIYIYIETGKVLLKTHKFHHLPGMVFKKKHAYLPCCERPPVLRGRGRLIQVFNCICTYKLSIQLLVSINWCNAEHNNKTGVRNAMKIMWHDFITIFVDFTVIDPFQQSAGIREAARVSVRFDLHRDLNSLGVKCNTSGMTT